MYNTPVRIDSTIVASRLKMARDNKGFSKAEVAKALNIATSSMTYYEQGRLFHLLISSMPLQTIMA